MITVGGVDTYYDYDECQWKYRRLGGGPVRPKQAGPIVDDQLTEARAEVIPSPDSDEGRPDLLHRAG
ncbi:hypothetical protein EV652_101543 [Kribbella steppae]|uniref:Uncharacterized protein n=1 Tax=Kribbella steppae TaxID=2512223 RepID=A0A4R2HYE4_9ACTN|nr:hypothetical protein [Kribbella steppae]TCO35658.1 hypothetical protein EV652_101543 [Kribbella steppae]